ncbi:MAG: lytic murein transglycosylase [Pseudomonadota bacterium]
MAMAQLSQVLIAKRGQYTERRRESTRSLSTVMHIRRRIGRKIGLVAALFLLIGPVALADTQAPVSAKPTPMPGIVIEADASLFMSSGREDMDAWRDSFFQRATAAGRDPVIVQSLLSDIRPLSIYLGDEFTETTTDIADQAEFRKPIWQYVEDAVTESRLERGASELAGMSETFEAIEARFGVDREVLTAIWAMETNLGSYIGSFDAANTLANMAVEGRRQGFAERELLALIRILERGDVREQDLISGWAGAMGQTQFMPTTFLSYAIDFDGDGNKDLWNSPTDALASAANYLASSGYQMEQPWGIEVIAPKHFNWALADGQSRRLSTWKSEGVSRINGKPFQIAEGAFAELWLPAGANGPKYLLLKNFEVFKTYNRSDSYALSVGLLADGMVGVPGPIGIWPRDLGLLSQQDIMDLQAGLNGLGYGAGPVDGIAGRGTKAALRAFQLDYGLLADGYPTQSVLDYVLSAAG